MAESKRQKSGGQNEYLNVKKNLCAQEFLNYCDKNRKFNKRYFFNFIIYVRGGNCDYSPPAPNNVVKLLDMFMIPCNFPVTNDCYQCNSYLYDLSTYLLIVLYVSGHNTAQNQPETVKVIVQKTTQK